MPSAYERTDIIMSEANNKVPGYPLKIFDFVSGSGSYIIFSRSGNISYGNAVYHIANGDISLKIATIYGIIQLYKLEFVGQFSLYHRFTTPH